MPRFLFRLIDDFGADHLEGRDLPNAAAARERAERLAEEVASARAQEPRTFNPHHCIQASGEGGVMIQVPFGDALRRSTRLSEGDSTSTNG